MTTTPPRKADVGSQTILDKLRNALVSDGDFPVRARIVNELRALASNPNTPIDKVTECILREPSLGTRVLHLVNSSFYTRTTPIATVSQAVMQIGMRSLADLCAGLVLLQRFVPSAKRGEIFADNIKQSILTAILTSAIAKELDDGDSSTEKGYLAGTFYTIGPMLLAYYFPQVFEAAGQRAQTKKQSLTQSLTEIVGTTPTELSMGVVDALAIPPIYREIMTDAYRLSRGEVSDTPPGTLAVALATATTLADAIVCAEGQAQLAQTIDRIATSTKVSTLMIFRVVGRLPQLFKDQCKLMEMTFLSLPDYLGNFAGPTRGSSVKQESKQEEVVDELSKYLDEIREAILSGETISSIISSVMETLAFGMEYDRVLLLYSDTKGTVLEGRMGLGKELKVDPKAVRRTLNADSDDPSPESLSYAEGTVQTYGEPMLPDGWPFVTLPVGLDDRTVGVIYADKTEGESADATPVSERMEYALNVLATLLDEALMANQ